MRAAVGSTVTLISDPFGPIIPGATELDPPTGHPENPTVTVTRLDGTELTEPSATVDGATVRVLLTAEDHLDVLDRLAVRITAEVNGAESVQLHQVDVVGSHWVTVEALRGEPDLGDRTRYRDELLAAVRDEWEAHLEELCNVAMVPQASLLRLRGSGSCELAVDLHEVTAVRSVTVDGEPVDLDDETVGVVGASTIRWDGGVFPRRAVVDLIVEHGLDRPPGKLVRELRKVVRRDVLARSARTPNDAIRETSPEGGVTIQYSTPDPSAGRWTGVLSLDPVIAEYRRAELGFA
jgi:hypothetical protein